MNFYGLMEADFLTTNLSFENIDFENLLDSQKSQPHLLESKSFFIQGLVTLFQSYQFFLFQISFLDQNYIRLRC
jgi:hypothetical protein